MLLVAASYSLCGVRFMSSAVSLKFQQYRILGQQMRSIKNPVRWARERVSLNRARLRMADDGLFGFLH